MLPGNFPEIRCVTLSRTAGKRKAPDYCCKQSDTYSQRHIKEYGTDGGDCRLEGKSKLRRISRRSKFAIAEAVAISGQRIDAYPEARTGSGGPAGAGEASQVATRAERQAPLAAGRGADGCRDRRGDLIARPASGGAVARR